MKVAVVTFPGSNCDEDAIHVTKNVLGAKTHAVWHKDTVLPSGTDLVILPGGFSYGDALRSGALARFSPVMEAVKKHAEKGGLVLGICNGFQILVEAGLLPGAMLQNASRKFVCRVVTLEVVTKSTPFSHAIPKGTLKIPVAHHEGRYYAAPEVLDRLEQEDRIVFRYLGDNPNGSERAIAGIVSRERNVLGLMPHPERASERILGSEDGLGIFRSIALFAHGAAA